MRLLILTGILLHCSIYLSRGTEVEAEAKPFKRLDFITRTKECGFEVDEHEATTEDGYILKLFRVKHDKKFKPALNPVLLQHGLLADANFWIIQNCSSSFPYQLARAGFDVWVSNSRGTLYSDRHISRDRKEKDYWNFTYDDMAKYDIPTIFNTVLSKSGKEKLNYVGHSQGTEILFGAPTFNESIGNYVENFFALAPITRLLYPKGFFGLAKVIVPWEFMFEIIFGTKDFVISVSMAQRIGSLMCPLVPQKVCSTPLFMISGYNEDLYDENITEDDLKSVLSSTSSKNMLHYYQGIGNDKFQLFDYGPFENMKRYEQETAPSYDLTKVDFPVYLFAGTNDWLAPMENIQWLESHLPQLKDKVYLDGWTHLDLVIGLKGPKYVFKKVICILQKRCTSLLRK